MNHFTHNLLFRRIAIGLGLLTMAFKPALNMLNPGDNAPEISAVATDGSTVQLKNYFGKKLIVIYFYPADNTGGCTREACDFRDSKADYDAVNAVVFGVSTDDLASHKDFSSRYNLNFPLLVDTDHAICNAFGVPVSNSTAKRVTFIIGLDGKIAKTWDGVHVIGHALEVLAELKLLAK